MLVAALVGATAAAASAEPPAATARQRDLVALAPPVVWRHELAWKLSSDDVLFGRLAEVDLLADGVLAITDLQLGQVLLLAPDGTVLRVLEVAGEGPGRLSRPAGVCEWDAEHLLLWQAWPGRAEIVRRDGTPVRSLVLGGRDGRLNVGSILALAGRRGGLVGVQAEVEILDSQQSLNVLRLCRFADDLVARHDILRCEVATVDRMGLVDETELDFPIHSWSLSGERRVVVAPRRACYRLETYADEHGVGEVFARDLPPLPRRQAEMDLLRAGFTLEVDGQRRAIDFVFHQTAQMIQEIVALDPRTLLLTTAYTFHALERPCTARLDLVDLDAATVREVRLEVPVSPDADRLLLLPNRDVVVLVGGGAALVRGDHEATAEPIAPSIAYWRFRTEGPR